MGTCHFIRATSMTIRSAAKSLLALTCPLLQGASDGSRAIEPVMSVKDARIAFASRSDGRWDIYTVSASGGEPTRLTTRAEQERFPVWSPDGSRISFASEGPGDRW